MMIDTSGIPKEHLLRALYNNAITIVGFDITPQGMTIEHAKRIALFSLSFDYLNGRKLFVNLYKDIIDFTEYDQSRNADRSRRIFNEANTNKLAAEIVAELRKEFPIK